MDIQEITTTILKQKEGYLHVAVPHLSQNVSICFHSTLHTIKISIMLQHFNYHFYCNEDRVSHILKQIKLLIKRHIEIDKVIYTIDEHLFNTAKKAETDSLSHKVGRYLE